MLVLARKIDEAIHLGPDITIVITKIGQGMVRLGIEAPKMVHIAREELLFTPVVVRELRAARAYSRYLRDNHEGSTDNTDNSAA